VKSATLFSALLLVASVVIASVGYAAEDQTSATQLTENEKWVVAQVNAGKTADLGGHFPEGQQKLRAYFLQELLAGTLPGAKPHRNLIRIIGAVVDEPVLLFNAQIAYDTALNFCEFKKHVNLAYATFPQSISFNNTTFQERASFYSIKVGSSCSFRNATFQGQADFRAADIGGDFVAEQAQFQVKGDLEAAAQFTGIKCRDGDFTGIRSSGAILFDGASFTDLYIIGNTAPGLAVPLLDLSGASIKRKLVVADVSVRDLVGRAGCEKATPNGLLDKLRTCPASAIEQR
jgi:hypothetical protein